MKPNHLGEWALVYVVVVAAVFALMTMLHAELEPRHLFASAMVALVLTFIYNNHKER